ncbi:MAG: SDR family oxidoreductase [Capsulimonadaceae bacterium]|nr:SDR family oxidoreductase [Capsulimonadaceae bacterium]
MRVFVTGATGFIGSALVPELINGGHKVLGMTRSESGAAALANAGADVHYGTLEDIESLKAGAAQADAVIHLAFNHDFSRFQANCEEDGRAIAAMGEALAGSGRPLVGTAGVLTRNPIPGQPYDEDDPKPDDGFPRLSENATFDTLGKGVRGIVVRLSQIHDSKKQGLVSFLIRIALEKKVSAYVGDGSNRWAAAHVSDTARLYRLALEKGNAGSRWHAVGEQGVKAKDIAEVLGRRLNLPAVSISPEEASAHFGILSHFVTLDSPASNTKTRERLGWEPTGPGLIADLEQGTFASS